MTDQQQPAPQFVELNMDDLGMDDTESTAWEAELRATHAKVCADRGPEWTKANGEQEWHAMLAGIGEPDLPYIEPGATK